jgi:hypothetical protein
MTNDEQNLLMSAEYAQTARYIENAKETLKKAETRDDGQYMDAVMFRF